MTTNEPYRVVFGGSWDIRPPDARVAIRFRLAPGDRYDDLGVRLIRVVNPLQQLAETKKNGR